MVYISSPRKHGTCAKFVRMMGYSDHFGKSQPGTSTFSALWVKAAQKFPKFADDQHEFIRKTHFQVQMDKLRSIGIDLSKRGPGVLDAVWSTSVQFGGATTLIAKALKYKDIETLTDSDVVKAIQNYKIANNSALFKSSSEKVRASTLRRAQDEKRDLLKLVEAAKEEDVPDGVKTIFDAISDLGKTEG